MSEDENRGYFPTAYYEGFLKFLHDNRSIIEVITYDDLDWGDDFDYRKNYPVERKRWQEKMKSGELDKNKIYVILQHDVDAEPRRTDKILDLERKYGIKSCNMFFNRRVKRKLLQKTGRLEFDFEGYQIDIDKWKKFEKEGFVFCYHANSFEQSDFDQEKSLKTFSTDVKELRKNFNVRYFSPHGGARSPDGESNNSLPIPKDLNDNIRWVANGQTVRFDGVFSDGGPNSKKRDPALRDLRDFVATWKPGKRYRVLTHPQYYFDPCGISERMAEASWYREMLSCYKERNEDYWENASISASDIPTLSNIKRSELQTREAVLNKCSNIFHKALNKIKGK